MAEAHNLGGSGLSRVLEGHGPAANHIRAGDNKDVLLAALGLEFLTRPTASSLEPNMQGMREIPARVMPEGDEGYLEELTKAIFRSGFSWRVVNDKWDNFRRSFYGFDVATVAEFGVPDISRLIEDVSIVRNKQKILATVENARTMLALAGDHGSFHAYLRSLDNLEYYARVKVLTGLFRNLGRTGAFVFLHSVNENTPSWHDR